MSKVSSSSSSSSSLGPAMKATAHAVTAQDLHSDEDDVHALSNVEIMPDDANDGLFKGEVQPVAYRDVPFAILFWLHVFGFTATAMIYGSAFLNDAAGVTDDGTATTTTSTTSASTTNDDDMDDSGLSGVTILLCITVMFTIAAACTTAALRLMMAHPTTVVTTAFFAAPITFGVVALLMTAVANAADADSGDVVYQYLWIVAAGSAALSICWYKCLERFIPFAATTLRTALTAIRGHFGLYILEIGLLLVLYAYTALWLAAFVGVVYHDHEKGQAPCSQVYPDDPNMQNSNEMCDTNPISMPAIFLFVLCLYWTQQVVQNLVHTTTSGVVGVWWFAPALGDPSCCGRDVTDSFSRAATYSFGSICFGSLLVSILQTLESMARRRRRDIITLVVQCLIICLRAWLEYFNSWAFCYVGLYGYDYLQAGKNVVQLFRERGWTTFIGDRLVFRVLLMANIGVATLSGVLCAVSFGAYLYVVGSPAADPGFLQVLFWIGFLVGLYVSNTILFIVESATRTVMVLFAESANEFAVVHGELYQDLKTGWSTSYPDAWEHTTVATAVATPVV